MFFNNRSAFFSLLRTNMDEDDATLDFWDDLNITYDQLKELSIVDRSIAKTFLHKLFENELIASHVLQYIKFNFQNDLDLVNYKVDFELEVEG